jgi:hypothetical protein
VITALFTVGGVLVASIIVAALLWREKPRPPKLKPLSFRQIKRSIRREGRFATKQLRELERDVRK